MTRSPIELSWTAKNGSRNWQTLLNLWEQKQISVKATITVNHVVILNLLDNGGLSHWQDFPSHLLGLALVGSGIRVGKYGGNGGNPTHFGNIIISPDRRCLAPGMWSSCHFFLKNDDCDFWVISWGYLVMMIGEKIFSKENVLSTQGIYTSCRYFLCHLTFTDTYIRGGTNENTL